MKKLRHVLAPSAFSLVGIATLSLSGQAYAGGFSLSEMSAASVGNAHAGSAAAEDLSTIYFNPAGLMMQSGRGFMIAGSAIRPSSKFNNGGSTTGTGAALRGGSGGDAGSWEAVPAIFYAMDLSRDLRFGIGLHSPFGLATEYDGGWAGRYQAEKSELKTLNINPSLAYRVNDFLSIGAGVSAEYVDVELSRAIDFGSVCIGSVGAGACVPGGFLPQAKDGKVTVKGNDWGYGYNFGLMFTPRKDTRFGFAYRSKISHGLSGNAHYDKPAGLPAALAASPTFSDTGATANLSLPESVSINGYKELDRKWSVMGDLTWMHWSRFKELRINFDNGAASSVTPEEWRNTYRVSAAVNYRYNDAWKLRGGVAFDQTPVQSQYRTPRIPDADRYWLSLGVQYKPTAKSSWDIGYAHLFVKDASIDKSEPPVGGNLVGTYKNDVNILSVQYNYAF